MNQISLSNILEEKLSTNNNLNLIETYYINMLIKSQPYIIDMISDCINNNINDDGINMYTIPTIVLEISEILEINIIVKNNEINIGIIIKFILQSIFNKKYFSLSNENIIEIYTLIDSSINLLNKNLNFNRSIENNCFFDTLYKLFCNK
jgi:hypothetical protein